MISVFLVLRVYRPVPCAQRRAAVLVHTFTMLEHEAKMTMVARERYVVGGIGFVPENREGIRARTLHRKPEREQEDAKERPRAHRRDR